MNNPPAAECSATQQIQTTQGTANDTWTTFNPHSAVQHLPTTNSTQGNPDVQAPLPQPLTQAGAAVMLMLAMTLLATALSYFGKSGQSCSSRQSD